MNTECDLIFRDTPCSGSHNWVPVDAEGNCLFSCEYHAALFVMLMELSNLYTPEQLDKFTLEELQYKWEVAFGDGSKKNKRPEEDESDKQGE